MEITEEQRKRAEANRIAALAKRKATLESSTATTSNHQDHWKLFKCRKISPEHTTTTPCFPKPPPPQPQCARMDHFEQPHLPEKFRARLEICSPDSFSITAVAVKGFAYLGEAECLRRLDDCLSNVMLSHYTQNHGGGKAHVYKLRDYDAVLKCLKNSKGIEIEKIPGRTFYAVERLSHSYVTGKWIPCRPEHLVDEKVDQLIEQMPKTLLDSLLPFQLDGVRYGLRRGARCLIADEMGLGKTLQAIAIACCFMDEGSILVVCPAILRYSWAEELERWLPCLPTDIHLVFGHRDNPAHLARFPRVVVISYTMLHHLQKKKQNTMLKQDWALLIVDESHHVRGTKKISESDEVKAVLDVARKTKRIVLLSGTPSLSRLYIGDHRPFDIYHQINMLWPGLLGMDKFKFAKTYCAVTSRHDSQGKIFQDYSKGTRLEELNVLLKQTVMVRRLKDHVLVELPPKRRQIIRLLLKRPDIVSAIAATRMENHDASKRNITEDKNLESSDETDDGVGYRKSSMKLSYQQLGIAKLSGFREWLSIHPIITQSDGAEILDMTSSSFKMIIFAHHHKVLNGIQEFLCDKGIGFVRIDGETLAKDRQSAVLSFQSSTEVKIAIIGIEAGGVGVDLSVAHNVVFLELPKSPNLMLQAEDRAHRRGQNKAVNIYIFCAKDTSDESRWQNLNRSLHRVSSTTNGKYDAIREIAFDSLHITWLYMYRESLCLQNMKLLKSMLHGLGYEYRVRVEDVSYLETLNKIDRSENGISKNEDLGDLRGKLINFANVSLVRDMQPVEVCNEEAEKVMGSFGGQGEPDGCSTQEAHLHVKADIVLKIKNGSPSKEEIEITSEVSTSERISLCELDVGHKDKRKRKYPETTEIYSSPSVLTTEANETHSNQENFLRFEVSRYTRRIHLYSCIPGADLRPRPLFLNFRPEEIESLDSLDASNNKKTSLQVIKENPAYRLAILAFMNEWNKLRPIERNKLLGKPLQLPLTVELYYLKEGINHNSGGLLKGGSKRRTTPSCEISHPLPSNAAWKKVRLCSGYGRKEKEYAQGWTLTDEPLCKLCQTPCKNNNAKTPEFFEDLFCNLGCYEEYRLRTSNRFIRQELFQIEHGVCTHCQLDCHKLVKHLKHLSLSKRVKYIKEVAPKVARRKKMLQKLVNDPIEGNAWHADHIVAVYQGGGECKLENMRTLCVACHYEVTASQRTERRSTRVEAKKQLKIIMNDLKKGQNTEVSEANSKDQPHLEAREDRLEDELFIKVPGSAYSGGKSTDTGNEDLEKSEKPPENE